MDLDAYIDLSVKVLTDWRVIVCVISVLVIWTLFRFVGVIAQRRVRRYQAPKKASPAPGGEKRGKT